MKNDIHPTAIIGDDVVMGKNNQVLPYTIIYGPTVIGDDNVIGPHVVIGTPGEDTKDKYYDSSNCKIEIGDRNIIREFTVVQKPAYEDLTRIGNDVFLMHGVHVPHDCYINDNAVVTPLCVIGGIVKIMKGANVGMGCTINQRSVIGHYSMSATNSAIMKSIIPFSRYIPNKPISVNEYAIKKYGFEEYSDEIRAYVMEGKAVESIVLRDIVAEYEMWVDKYESKEYYR